MAEQSLKNCLASFRLSPGKFEETEVYSKYYFLFLLFINGKFVIENHIFCTKAEVYVNENGEVDLGLKSTSS